MGKQITKIAITYSPLFLVLIVWCPITIFKSLISSHNSKQAFSCSASLILHQKMVYKQTNSQCNYYIIIELSSMKVQKLNSFIQKNKALNYITT